MKFFTGIFQGFWPQVQNTFFWAILDGCFCLVFLRFSPLYWFVLVCDDNFLLKRLASLADYSFIYFLFFKIRTSNYCMVNNVTKHSHCVKCLYLEFFWSLFSRIRTEYVEILRIFPYSLRMRENTDQKNCEHGHFFTQRLLRGFERQISYVVWSSH